MIVFVDKLESAEHLYIWLTGAVGSAIVIKTLNYISKQMPPLPSDCGWWTKFFYQLLKGASLHDPTNNAKPGA